VGFAGDGGQRGLDDEEMQHFLIALEEAIELAGRL
jgi:hypothetical protein